MLEQLSMYIIEKKPQYNY